MLLQHRAINLAILKVLILAALILLRNHVERHLHIRYIFLRACHLLGGWGATLLVKFV